MKQLKLEDFTSYRFLSALRLSPDGRHAAFVCQTANLEKNNYDGAIWLYDLEKDCCRQLTAAGDQRSFLWLDGSRILFASGREKGEPTPGEMRTDFFVIDIHGGEAAKAFSVPAAVGGIRRLAEHRFVLSACYDPALPVLEGLREEEKAKARKQYQEDQDYLVMDELPFWRNGQGHTNKKRNRLYLLDSGTGRLEPLTGEQFQVDSWELSPDGRQLAIVGSEYGDIEPLRQQLSLCDLEERSLRVLIPQGRLSIGQVKFVGGELWFSATDGANYGLNENRKLYTLDPAAPQPRLLCGEDLSLGSSVGSDNRLGGGRNMVAGEGALYFTATHRFCSRLCRLGADGELALLSREEGSVDCFDLWQGEDREVCLFVGMRENRLQELYRLDLATGEERQLTGLNRQALEGRYLAVPQYLPFVDRDGVEIDGWVLYPKDYQAGQRYPAILDIHGGPKTVYGTVLYHEMQLWANLGYFVLFCNPRGGDGRGNPFMDIRGRYGQEDYRDIMEFVDHILDRCPDIDPKRLGVTGGSYGGFMTNWIIGQTGRFAAAASQRSIASWISMAGTSDIGPFFSQDQTASNAWDNFQDAWNQSPLQFANRCTTPTLFIHSEEDYRCWEVEALQMFTALKLHGVETRLCLFKGENHELSRSGKPRHRIRRLREITDWFESHLKG